MDQMTLRKFSKYFLIIVFIIILVLSFILVRSYLTSVIAAMILAYIFYPIYKKLNTKIKSEDTCSVIMIIMISLIILVPIFLVINALFREAFNFVQHFEGLNINFISDYSKQYNIDFSKYLSSTIEFFSKFILDLLSKFFLSIPQRILQFFIMLFVMFYSFRDGEKMISKLENLLPLRSQHKKRFFDDFKGVTKGVVYGLVVTGIIQGAIGGVGFYVLGIPNAFLWGLVMAFLSILPVLGPYLVWAPAGVYLLFTGDVTRGIILLIYGALAISSLDNLIRPKIIGSKTKIHPVLVLLGILGGLSLFGFIGVIIGPLILSFLVLFLKMYSGQEK